MRVGRTQIRDGWMRMGRLREWWLGSRTALDVDVDLGKLDQCCHMYCRHPSLSSEIAGRHLEEAVSLSLLRKFRRNDRW